MIRRVVAWSGTRRIPTWTSELIAQIAQDTHAELHVSGACIGVDQLIASTLIRMHPGTAQRIIVPSDRSRVDMYWLTDVARVAPNVELVQMPPGSSYRNRNSAVMGDPDAMPPGVIPHHVDLLVAFPLNAEDDPESRRSGTWQTIRMARRAGIATRAYVLNQAGRLGTVVI